MKNASFIILMAVTIIGASCSDTKSKHALPKTYQLRYPSELVLSEKESLQVKFVPCEDETPLGTFSKLGYSVLIASKVEGDYSVNGGALFVVGQFVDGYDERHHVPKPKSDMAGGFEPREFVLTGWGVQTPFFEYPQSSDPGNALPPILRVDLRPSDFEAKINNTVIRRDERIGLYWIGDKPQMNKWTHATKPGTGCKNLTK